eukprot:1055997-Pelagomonas_calceolata.AAC.2
MILFWSKDSKSLKITQFGAVGGQGWRLGGQKVGFTPWLIRHVGRDLGELNRPFTFCNQAWVSKIVARLCWEHSKNTCLWGGSCPVLITPHSQVLEPDGHSNSPDPH